MCKMVSILNLSKEYEKSANILLERIKFLKNRDKNSDKEIERRLAILKTEYYETIHMSHYLKNYYKHKT